MKTSRIALSLMLAVAFVVPQGFAEDTANQRRRDFAQIAGTVDIESMDLAEMKSLIGKMKEEANKDLQSLKKAQKTGRVSGVVGAACAVSMIYFMARASNRASELSHKIAMGSAACASVGVATSAGVGVYASGLSKKIERIIALIDGIEKNLNESNLEAAKAYIQGRIDSEVENQP